MTKYLLGLGLLLLSPWSMASLAHWQQLYGSTVWDFSVLRKGQQVGQYRLQFVGGENDWQVISELDMNIAILWWHYDYHYQAVEQWQGEQLQSLRITINDNGEQSSQLWQRQGEVLQGPDGRQLALPLWLSHHYDRRVLEQTQLFNTLTGRLNRFQLGPISLAAVHSNGQPLEAQGFAYEGELHDTQVWYDQQGRWVGLRFKARDASWIELRCRRCQVEP